MTNNFIKRQIIISGLQTMNELRLELDPYLTDGENIEGMINMYEYLMNDTEAAINDLTEQMNDIQNENEDMPVIYDLAEQVKDYLEYVKEKCL